MPLEQCSKWEIHSLSNFLTMYIYVYIYISKKKDDIDKNLILIKKFPQNFLLEK